jgi:hypothetical protein
MMPLYHAVAHGCKAGLWQAAFLELRVRIWRNNEIFSLRKLGACGTDLVAVSSFFRSRWSVLRKELSDEATASLLNVAGYELRALGRLSESRGPREAPLAGYIDNEDWKNCAITTSSLSEVSLTLGDVSSAVRQGEWSVELADRSGDAFQRMARRTTLADALHAAGDGGAGEPNAIASGDPANDASGNRPAASAVGSRAMAPAAFREAEAMQKEMQPQYPLLYSQRGYKYCDLLLESPEPADESPEQAIARIRQVRERAEEMHREHSKLGLLSIALHELALGRTYLLESQEARVQRREQEAGSASDSCLSALDSAEQHLNQSVSLLRQAGTQDELPRGLLHRAALWRAKAFSVFDLRLPTEEEKKHIANRQSAIENAVRDLAEAETIAERGSMLIWQIEAALERTRLYLALASADSAPLRFKKDDQNTETQRTRREYLEMAREKLDEVKRLVEQTERPYEPHVPDWDDWEPPPYVGVFQPGQIVGYHRRNQEIEALQRVVDEGSASVG